MQTYKSKLEKAYAANFTPTSDFVEDLIKFSLIGAGDHGKVVGVIRKHEAETGSELTGCEKHTFVYEKLYFVQKYVEQYFR